MSSHGLASLISNQSTTMNSMHLNKPYEFRCFGCIDTKSEHANEQHISHQTISIHMVWQHWYQISARHWTACISTSHMNSYCLAALIPNQSTTMNNMHITKSYEFLWFGCIDTKSEHDNEQHASHQNKWIPMVWLHWYQIRARQWTTCISPNHMNSYALAALIPNQSTTMNSMRLTKTIWIPMVWLHWHQIRARKWTACISPNHMNSYGLAALILKQSTIMNSMHLTKPNEFLWFGCIDTKSEHDNEQHASHQTVWIPMVWLHKRMNYRASKWIAGDGAIHNIKHSVHFWNVEKSLATSYRLNLPHVASGGSALELSDRFRREIVARTCINRKVNVRS